MSEWEYEYKPYALKDMARRLDIGVSDLEALHRYKNNSFWFDYAFVDGNGHTTDKM